MTIRDVVAVAIGSVAFVAVLATLAIPRTAGTRSEASRLGFGYPVSFVSVDETVWNPPNYPQTYRYDPWEDIADVRGEILVLDWLLVAGALFAGYWLLTRRRTSSRQG